MKTHSILNKGLWTLTLAAALLLSFAARSDAGEKINIGGVTVSYSGTGMNAYFYEPDGTLTIELPPVSGGTLSVNVGSSAYLAWGSYVDIFLVADYASLKSISIKGQITCTPFVIGQVGFVNKFSLSKGVVGGTDYYGLDFGIGMVSTFIPSSISLKQSYTTAQLFGYPYGFKDTASRPAASAARAPGAETDSSAIRKAQPSPEKAALIEKVQGARSAQ